jgi:amino acid transporter
MPKEFALSQKKNVIPSLGLCGAISTNFLNMVGVGPFLTIPLILSAMNGPQAIMAWVLGAVISLCDGMVWAELGSRLPFTCGPYYYLSNAYDRYRLGPFFAFLFIWQSMILGPLSIASGAVGVAQYLQFLFPAVHHTGLMIMAMGVCFCTTVLLHRSIDAVARISLIGMIIVLGSMIWIVVVGVLHQHLLSASYLGIHVWKWSRYSFSGLGSATLIALYDFGGYANVCMIASEVREPQRTIPRTIKTTIVGVALLYLLMNISIIGVIPWQQAMQSHAIVADLMEAVYGRKAGTVVAILVAFASFSSVYAVMLGYSRVPYAGSVEGELLPAFGRLHERGKFPYVALWFVGVTSVLCCLLKLQTLITALMITQAIIPSIAQCGAVIILRRRNNLPRGSYRMPFYPIPVVIAAGGWILVITTNGLRYLLVAFGIFLFGSAVYWVSFRRRNTLQIVHR